MNIQAFTHEYIQSLYENALHLNRQGIPTLAIRGDVAQELSEKKKPAIDSWSPYRVQLPTEYQLKQQYLENGFGGLAIVLGELAKLVCLEFDNLQLADAFMLECPNLTDTYTELSAGRGLPHYFFRPPHGERLDKRGRAGQVELLGEGQYVIVAPTTFTVDNVALTYTRVGGTIKNCTSDEWQQLTDFIERYAPAPESTPYELLTDALAAGISTNNSDWLAQVYIRKIATCGGRNNALFSTAQFARDIGLQSDETTAALLHVFIASPPPPGHHRETTPTRMKEARATIASAYTRAARPRLPNAIREKLLNTKQGQVARLLDMLLLQYTPGQRVQLRDAEQVATQLGMGRATLLKAFTELEKISGGILVSEFPVYSIAVSLNATVSGKSDTKNKRGRPAGSGKYVVLPHIETLCEVLNVVNQGGDVVTLDGLKTVAAYRDTLEKAYLKRDHDTTAARSGRRLGTTRRTAHSRLNRINAGRREQEPKRELITPKEAAKLPAQTGESELYAQYRRRGAFLEVDTGRITFRRAPTIENAQKAWEKGYVVCLCYPMPIIRTAPPIMPDEQIITTAQPIELARAVGAENDYIAQSAVTPQETVITTDPLLIELTSLGGVLVPIATGKTRRRPPENKSGGAS